MIDDNLDNPYVPYTGDTRPRDWPWKVEAMIPPEISIVERALKAADRLIDTMDPSEIYVLSGIRVADIREQITLALMLLRRHRSLNDNKGEE